MSPPPKRSPVVCHCLHVTEDDVLDALDRWEIKSLRDLEKKTTAGGGCMSCHPLLKEYLQRQRQAS
jgi:NAD(P)H-nitrite reductase large subunit